MRSIQFSRKAPPKRAACIGWFITLGAAFGLTVLPASRLAAQASSGYQVNESNSGPVRMCRFSDVSGSISWRADSSAPWSEAAVNLPLRQDAEIAASGGGRAEIEFDDGSHLRMARGAVVTLRTMYSDSQGEFTEIAVRSGVIGLGLRQGPSVYQIDTPIVSVDASGPARFRVDCTSGVQVGVSLGRLTVEGNEGKETLSAGQYLSLGGPRAYYHVRSLPPADGFDHWSNVLYDREDRYWNGPYHT
ncbi:MAG TPA: FecR domain-containing protein, partial [Chthonomonadales bacterium]|nr:FecR domain-containing protein [Chthonomonadales bacterium]